MAIWIDLEGRQFYDGSPPAEMDAKRARHGMLVDVGDLDMGERVTNVSFTLDIQAIRYLDPPPNVATVYDGSVEIFTGSVDRIQIGDSVDVSARA